MKRLKTNLAQNKRLIICLLGILVFGTAYYVFIRLTHISIPCVFHMVTGLKCPGCGITGMFLCLAKADFVGAFHKNAAVFCLLPFWIIYGAIKILFNPKWTEKNSKAEKILIWTTVAVLIMFGILRNVNIILLHI